MKRSDLVKQQHYAATNGTAKHRREYHRAVRVEVLEVGVERKSRTSDPWHSRMVVKNDGVRVRFVTNGSQEFGFPYGSVSLQYDNGSCAEGKVGVIQARDIWMAWDRCSEMRNKALSDKASKEELLLKQRSRAEAVVSTFGRGDLNVGTSRIGRPQVILDLADAEKVAAVVEEARRAVASTSKPGDQLPPLEDAVNRLSS